MLILLLLSVRLTEAHKTAIRVIRRIRYFVGRRKFQVISIQVEFEIALQLLLYGYILHIQENVLHIYEYVLHIHEKVGEVFLI